MHRISSQELKSLHGGTNELAPEAGMKEDFIVAIVSHVVIRIGEALWDILWGKSSKTKPSSHTGSFEKAPF